LKRQFLCPSFFAPWGHILRDDDAVYVKISL
jgi:hypothetical protein